MYIAGKLNQICDQVAPHTYQMRRSHQVTHARRLPAHFHREQQDRLFHFALFSVFTVKLLLEVLRYLKVPLHQHAVALHFGDTKRGVSSRRERAREEAGKKRACVALVLLIYILLKKNNKVSRRHGAAAAPTLQRRSSRVLCPYTHIHPSCASLSLVSCLTSGVTRTTVSAVVPLSRRLWPSARVPSMKSLYSSVA